MKILRAYAVTVMICLSIISVTACVFVADENARKISFGSESAVAVINSSDEGLSENTVNLSEIFIKIKNVTEKAVSISPPPLSNIYWFIVNSENLLS
ncbi:MAG: hypothetical protein U0L11_04040 [Acutalibacteraceae bacterium]|nr:hypothetical protein [Acutalibacteraceae bacterium]